MVSQPTAGFTPEDRGWMQRALRLARRGLGATSPNPMVGAVLVNRGRVIGQGWHRRAGEPHAEVEAIGDAAKRGESTVGSTLYVTLEPCSTHGRTPPCTDAIRTAGIACVFIAAVDPNPAHAGRGLRILKRRGVAVHSGLLREASERLNEAFNHWIVNRTPHVTVKAAMTLDGKIATESGQSKWITGPAARDWGMRLRCASDAILVGMNTVQSDNPSLTCRRGNAEPRSALAGGHRLRRVVLDSRARIPLDSRLLSDEDAEQTIVVVTGAAPARRLAALSKRVTVWICPGDPTRVDPAWLMTRLGSESVTSLLVEGGGEVAASFFEKRLVHRVAFFYAPMILGGLRTRKAVAGNGVERIELAPRLENVEWRRVGADLLLLARVQASR